MPASSATIRSRSVRPTAAVKEYARTGDHLAIPSGAYWTGIVLRSAAGVLEQLDLPLPRSHVQPERVDVEILVAATPRPGRRPPHLVHDLTGRAYHADAEAGLKRRRCSEHDPEPTHEDHGHRLADDLVGRRQAVPLRYVDPAGAVAGRQPQHRLAVLDGHDAAIEQIEDDALLRQPDLGSGGNQLVLQTAWVVLALGVVGEQQVRRLALLVDAEQHLLVGALVFARADPRRQILRERRRQVVVPLAAMPDRDSSARGCRRRSAPCRRNTGPDRRSRGRRRCCP